MMARSRRPFSVVVSGTLRSAWACFRDSQLPARTPMDFALFTRWMPAANSGASKPLSVASTASLRMADMRTMMLDDPSPRSSSVTRQAFTRGFRETWPWLQPVPVEEFVQGHVVDPFRDGRPDGVEYEALHPSPFCCFVNYC